MSLSFAGHTVVVTGAGGGLGRAYSVFFGSRGANVVVNDVSAENAQKVVDQIVKAGGKAVVNTSSVTDGAAVIKTAVDNYGTVTILINNAGILRDKGFKNMTDQEFDLVYQVHVKGAFSVTKAAWPYFRKQKFGRVINTASAAGLFGNFGQANYSAAKMALVTLTKTLAYEGAKYGIKCSAIAPIAASPMTETIMPPEMLKSLSPEFIVPLVAVLAHPNGPDASGKVFELGAGFMAEIRWERTKGVIFKPDASYTPSAIKEKWSEITDFSGAMHPKSLGDNNIQEVMAAAASASPVEASSEVRFDGKTVIITGAGAGLGRIYALMYSKLGANVVVNDVSEKGANSVVDEIKKAGGKAVAAVTSAEDGEAIVKKAVDTFGTVHILIANAGILRDKSFAAMTEQEWDSVFAVHLRGTYKCAKAVWPIFLKQKYGRILTTSSGVGLYGNFGQANYSAAKAGIIGLTKTLAIEGKKYGILANVLAPSAGTAMTQTIWTQEMVEAIKPDFVAPIVGYLTSEDNQDTTGCIFESAAGWNAQVRWQRSGGHGFPHNKPLSPEDVIGKWSIITGFEDGRTTHPTSTQESLQQIVDNFGNVNTNAPSSGSDGDSELVANAKKEKIDPIDFTYTERDVILYNLGIGANAKDLKWTYENDDEFEAIPTFGVVPQFAASSGLPLDWLPNFNPAKLLHGEQFLSIKKPIPTSGTFTNQAKILEVLDKGKAAAVTVQVETKDSKGDVIFENQSTVFIRGSGGFGGRKSGLDRGAASAANVAPKRKPDAVVEEKTSESQAALYRMSGDLNPLHIQPEFAAIGGFDKPILHGLCSLGFSGKHVLQTFGPWKDIKTRFVGVVYPGQTLVTEMWKEGNKVVFVTKVKETGATVLSSAAATLVGPKPKL
ncbi:hypothetical protein FRB93_013834 [Tulasnella sp. JGI-2019a]|nr:hypothetical protein FRB93_013834 [Tulasnella sp. JGI-2019a]